MSIRLKKTVPAKYCPALMILSVLAAIAWSSAAWAAPTVMFDPIAVSTLAGGTYGFADGIGTAARFNFPHGVSVDNSGNLWVADQGDNRIRKIVIATGEVSTIAGDGTQGFYDAIGTASKFYFPSGVAADAGGNIWVADWENQRIRKIVIATGMVSTIAGNGTEDFADGFGTAAKFYDPRDVFADTSGNLYVTDNSNQRIRKIVIATGEVSTIAGNSMAGFVDGTGAAASFKEPIGITGDTEGNLYVADSLNHCIRKIVIATGEVTTVAGNGTQGFADGFGTSAQFREPRGIAADTAGNLWVSDTWNQRIRKIVIATGEVTTIAGDGTQGFADGFGTAAEFQHPFDVAADTAGNLYVADYNNSRIRKMTPPTLSTFSSTAGTASAAQSFSISGNSLTGNLTVTAPTGYEVSLSSGSGYSSTLNITPTSGVVNSKLIYIRLAAATMGGVYNGNITIASAGAISKTLTVRGVVSGPVVMFDPIAVSTLAGDGNDGFADGTGIAAQFNYPDGIVTDNSGNLYVADSNNNRIRKIVIATGAVTTLAGDGTPGSDDGIGTFARFSSPWGLAADTSGNLYVADTWNNRIRKIVIATGEVTTLAGDVQGFADGTGASAQFYGPRGVSADTSGNLYVADSDNHCIRKIVISTGVVTTLAGDGTPGFADGTGISAKFNAPTGMAADTSGNLYVADHNSNSIRKIVMSTGEVTTLAGDGTYGYADGIGTAARFYLPRGVTADTSGNLYVADLGNQRIRKIVISTGEVTTLAGDGTDSSFADGIGTAAKFNNPSAISADIFGNLYVADNYNHRIRKMTSPSLMAFSATAGTASAVQSFSISGHSLTAGVTITAPAGYEISLSSGSGYAASLNITPTAGIVTSTWIYIRLSASVGIGTYNGNLTLASAGVSTQNLAVTGTVVVPPPPSVMFDSVVSTLAGSTQGYVNGIGAAAKFSSPMGIAADISGNLYVADYGNHRIRKIDTATGEVTLLAGAGGVAGGFVDGIGSAAKFACPSGIVFASNDLYLSDTYNHSVRKIVISSGAVTTLAGNGSQGFADGSGYAAKFKYPFGIASDTAGNLYVADTHNHRIRKVVITTGAVTTLAGGVQGFAEGIGTAAMFNRPVGVAADTSGNLYVADSVNHRIRKIDTATGAVTTLAGSSQGFADSIGAIAQFDYPNAVAADTSGNLYVADRNNNRIRKIVISTGVVTTLAGQAAGGWMDGIGRAAKFNYPSSIVADSSGNLYVTDGGNRIRKMTPPTLTAFSTITGTASTPQSFGVSGNFLTGSLTLTAPTGYELSLNAGSGYAASLNITPTSGVLNTTLIYIRLSAAAGVGTYNGNIALDSAGATQKTLAVTGTVTATPMPEINLKQGATDIASGGFYNFGNMTIGSNIGAIMFTIENTGTADMILGGTPKIAISGSSDFTIDQSGTSSPVAASGNTTFTVTFTPSSAGAKNAVITIVSNDSDEGSYTVMLNGTGTAAPITGGVSIISVSNVKATTALATGYSGESGATERGFFWWNDTRYWGDNASGLIPADGSGVGNFSLKLTDLPMNTQLYVSAYVKIGDQIITSGPGNFISITTTGPVPPTVITKSDFTVSGTEVLAKGEITDAGSSSVTIYGFVYAKHPAPTVWDQALPFTWDNTLPISQGKAFEGTIKNFTAGTYYFRAYARNAQGTAYGEEFSFTITAGDCTDGVPGDLNGDGIADLTDIVIALKILDDVPVSSPNLKGDVNGDCKIGLEEAIFVLQKVGMLR